MHILTALLLGVLGACSAGAPSPAGGPRDTLHVSPRGDDGNDGSRSRPFASLPRALRELKRLRARPGGRRRTLTLRLAAGVYELRSGLVLEAGHCGEPGFPTRILGEGARLRGSMRLDPSQAERDGPALVLDLAGRDTRVLDPILPRGMGLAELPVAPELFDARGPLRRARWPNKGFATYETVLDGGSVPRNLPAGARGPLRGGTFVFPSARLASWAAEPELWVLGYWRWDWAEALLPVAEVDPRARTLRLARPHRYGLKKGGRFFVVNAKCELDAPGEYYLDRRAKKLFFLPREGSGNALRLSLLREPLLHLVNANDCVIQGLRFEETRGDALRIEKGTDVRVEACEFRGTGLAGIRASGVRIRILRCLLEDLGASGIVLSGGDRRTLRRADGEIAFCEIRRFGRLFRTYRPGIALSGVGQRVRRNLLHHAPHSALIFRGNEHLIEENEIHDVLLETGDCGAIYTGRDWTLFGTVIRGNYFHDLPGTENRWQNAVYLDDMASGIRVEGNLFVRCNSGMLVGGGRYVTIRGNVFVDSKIGIRYDNRGVGWMAKNIRDPRTSTLHKRLAAVPIEEEPWASRYPMLRRTLTERFGHPLGGRILGNAFFRTKLGRIVDRDCVEVRGNLVGGDPPPLFREASKDGPRFASPLLRIEGIPNFPPIPLDRIGLQGTRPGCPPP